MAVMPPDGRNEDILPTFTPKLPDLGTLDYKRLVIGYDRESDTLVAHFCGRGREAESILADDGSADRLVDVESDDVVGIQVEDFLARVVRDRPQLVDVLDMAELNGVSRDEIRGDVRRIKHELPGGVPRRIASSVRRRVEPEPRRKRAMVERLLETGPRLRVAAAL